MYGGYSSISIPGTDLALLAPDASLSLEMLNQPLHLAVGMFDGVHIGHQLVIGRAVKIAGEEGGGLSGVLTFNPHPSRVLHPETATELIMPLEDRLEKIFGMGVVFVLVQEFTSAYAQIAACEFIPLLKETLPGLTSLHVGENFRFGAGRKGDVNTILESSRELGLIADIMKREHYQEDAVSSSRIRHALRDGRIKDANTMLGAPYSIQGPVAPGRKIGRRLGYPTFNIAPEVEVLPRFGVYLAVMRSGDRPQSYLYGVANLGTRPTLGQDDSPVLEMHLLDCEKVPEPVNFLRIYLLEFIRVEMEFADIEALRAQISEDIKEVRKLIASRENTGLPIH